MTRGERYNRVIRELTLKDLLVDITGKVLVGLGLGALFAHYLRPYTWWLIIVGLVLSVSVKAKYWKRFWSS